MPKYQQYSEKMGKDRKDTLAEPASPGILFNGKLVMASAIPTQNGAALLSLNVASWLLEPVPGDS